MKALILDGSKAGDDLLHKMHGIITDELKGRGWETGAFVLRDMKIDFCRGCFGCWVKTPGECIIGDAGRDVARAAAQSDLLVYLTPVVFGGYSADLKKALDRMISLVSPFFMKIDGEVHHRPRYDRYPRLVGIGALDRPDPESEEIFTTLISRNAINMHNPRHAGGVVVRSLGGEAARKEILRLLAGVGVG